MKILAILTGGTIGSVIHDGYIYTDDNAKKLVVNNYLEKNDNDVEFQIVEPFTVHSEYLSHIEINTLVDIVCDSTSKDYDGIIVTHGTDSLQFTASALSYAVGNCNIPVLLVSAQYPMADFRSNGQINFNGAVDFIKNKPSIPAAQIQSDWSQADNTKLDYIKNKPTIPSVDWLVTWASSSTDWNIVVFDWATGKVIKDSWLNIQISNNPSWSICDVYYDNWTIYLSARVESYLLLESWDDILTEWGDKFVLE